MNYLVIDAVDEPARVVVLGEEGVLGEASISSRTKLAENLLGTIDGVLAAHNLTVTELDKLGIVNEPASFTSLRLSLSVVNALAYGLNVPIVELRQIDLHDTRGLLRKLEDVPGDGRLLPDYGRPPTITR